MIDLKQLLNIKEKEENKKKSCLRPIVHTEKTYNGGTSCSATDDYQLQKKCFFYEKSPYYKRCDWLRENIRHCSNYKAQRYKKNN